MNATSAKVIALRIYNPSLKGSEISSLIGISRERVRQILKKYELPTKASINYNSCLQCKKSTGKTGRKFCNPTCRTLYINIQLECEVCHNKFDRRKAVHEHNLEKGYKHIYCCKQCQGHWLGVHHGGMGRGRVVIKPIRTRRNVVVKTYEEALQAAYKWSKTKPFNMGKIAAKTYIESITVAEQEGLALYGSADHGRKTQLVYILSNLQHWRGENARVAKKIIKEHIEELKHV